MYLGKGKWGSGVTLTVRGEAGEARGAAATLVVAVALASEDHGSGGGGAGVEWVEWAVWGVRRRQGGDARGPRLGRSSPTFGPRYTSTGTRPHPLEYPVARRWDGTGVEPQVGAPWAAGGAHGLWSEGPSRRQGSFGVPRGCPVTGGVRKEFGPKPVNPLEKQGTGVGDRRGLFR